LSANYNHHLVRKLFLDDTRQAPNSSWDVVRSYRELVAYITKHGAPDVMSSILICVINSTR